MKSGDDNQVHKILGTIAVQLSLIEVLKELELIPDVIVGSSIGELTAAYLENFLTLDEVVLAAFYISVIVGKTKRGKMDRTDSLCK